MEYSRVLLLAVIAFGAGSSTVSSAMARVILKERTAYYSVKGHSGREIFNSMLSNGPKLDGIRQHALATSEYKYDIKNIKVDVVNGRCRARKLDIVVSVKYTYPRWTGSKRAKATTRNAWNQFLKSVVWHEKQHAKIAMEYARDYEKVLKKTSSRVKEKCSKVSIGTLFRANRITLKHNRKQKLFDKRDLAPGGRGYRAQIMLLRAE